LKVGEARPYFDGLQADLAQETDPQLRNWYQTETSVSAEYQEAVDIRTNLERLHFGLSKLIELATTDKQTDVVVEVITPKEGSDESDRHLDGSIDDDEYLTPEQSKQKSVQTWLKNVTAEYRHDVRVANSQKKSKKEKQLDIAKNRFARHFERFGDNGQHIVHDSEALEFVLDELLVKNPGLAETVVQSSVNYMHQNGVEFSEDYSAFANIIGSSLDGKPTTQAFERILYAIYEKKDFSQAIRCRTASY